MVKLREGDLVTFTARVTRVANYDEGQQICAKILPNGKDLGWCIMKENAFEPKELVLNVGDHVKMTDRPGHTDPWEIKAIFDNNQVAVQKVGNWPVEMANAKNLRRI